ncbi:Ger(x)C family spore germination protein [Paenibacillus tyrfis]|uniref:Ger(x)C family spore germination protein n=1 Tax=Paenibacillus tyrfis TaxID=1501230 RepID=UPI00209E7855|nr:Ger(x)C family spore germination protein [Paenibacillus tyrfis]MCP1309054.1 Ger(x)C family spore germination protein [Paenibacillus tyrfis]
MNGHRMLRGICMVILLGLLTGCWDAKEIQDINYITALGIDYAQDEYVVYAQMMDFTSVAKQEGGKPSQKASVWVSKSTGLSVNDALQKMYRTAQQLMYYSHINAIIYSEAVLKRGPEVIFDLTNRYREIRYTKWAYSSRESMEKILSVTPFFNESPLSSILHEPKETYKQSSYIVPVQFQRFISYYYERGKSSYLPSLAMNSSIWKENFKSHTLLEIEGCFFMDHSGVLKGFLSQEDLTGLRWVNPKTVRTPVILTHDAKIVASIVVHKPKVVIEPGTSGNKPVFNLHIRLKGSLNELAQNVSEAKLKELAERQIVKDIRNTYEAGIKSQIDVYDLGYSLYLNNPAKWKMYFGKDSKFPLQRASLQTIDVQINIENTGKYHLRV